MSLGLLHLIGCFKRSQSFAGGVDCVSDVFGLSFSWTAQWLPVWFYSFLGHGIAAAPCLGAFAAFALVLEDFVSIALGFVHVVFGPCGAPCQLVLQRHQGTQLCVGVGTLVSTMVALTALPNLYVRMLSEEVAALYTACFKC